MKVKAKCIKILFKKDDYAILSWSPIGDYDDELDVNAYGCFSTKGKDAYVDEGEEYEIELKLINTDKKFGSTYKITSAHALNLPSLSEMNREQKFDILMKCTTSERIANNILDVYPNFIELILEKGKEAIDTKLIKGVGEAYLNAYDRMINTKFKYFVIMEHFSQYNLNLTDCTTLCKFYGDEDKIDQALKADPYYCLCNVLGQKFEKADTLLMDVRPELKETEIRCAHLILSVLEINEQSGSTRLNGNDLYYYIQNEYKVPELMDLIVPTVQNSDLIYFDEESKDLSSMSTYMAECKVADFVKTKLSNPHILDIDWAKYTNVDGFELTEQQSEILKIFCEQDIMILAGYSGSGKTSSTVGLIRMMEDNDISYTLLAPTGKAALRMSEAVHRKASTIHRTAYKVGEINSDVIIVDETSMVDLPTMVLLLNCITNDDCKVIFVGDSKQLSPVGVGQIFYDMIESHIVPMVMLDKIFRYSTNGGLFVATNIRQGKNFFEDTDMVKQKDNVYTVCDNYKFIQCAEDDMFDTLVSEYNALLKRNIKPKDILILSPFNVGDIGTYALNNEVQQTVNPNKANQKSMTRTIGKVDIHFRVGDRVLNKKNDYKALPLDSYNEIMASDGFLTIDDVPVSCVFNGQEGIVRQVEDNYIVVQFDEELIVMDRFKVTENLLLGNCISVHSSQGSEAPYVINVVSPIHARMLNRNLLYVADTRAKIKHIDIGDKDTFIKAIAIDGNKLRNTWLQQLLNE